jgi:hypothetical protein
MFSASCHSATGDPMGVGTAIVSADCVALVSLWEVATGSSVDNLQNFSYMFISHLKYIFVHSFK